MKERIDPDLQARGDEARDRRRQLTEMMGRVVEEGTGTAAALSGVRVAGKTGTAEVGANREFTQPWFICFAPIDDPRIAVAVTLERSRPGRRAARSRRRSPSSVLEAMLGGGG